MILYSPLSSVIVVRVFSIRAGLDASTVTPGKHAARAVLDGTGDGFRCWCLAHGTRREKQQPRPYEDDAENESSHRSTVDLSTSSLDAIESAGCRPALKRADRRRRIRRAYY